MSRVSAAPHALPRHLPEATLAAIFALLFLLWSGLTLTGYTAVLDTHIHPPILDRAPTSARLPRPSR